MSPLNILIIVLMAVGLIVFVAEPLRRRIALPPGQEEQVEIETLVLQKEGLYMAIHDLDFDFQTGKVDQQDYVELRQDLEDEAVQILRRLDDIDPSAALDAELEHQIAVLRQQLSDPESHTAPETCPQCQMPLHGDENFCAACGQDLFLA